MSAYQITVRGRGNTVQTGTTPLEAFTKAFPDIILIPTKERQLASVCIELLDGRRKTKNFYLAQAKPIVEEKPKPNEPKYDFKASSRLALTDEVKKKIIQLCSQNLVLESYDYNDIDKIGGGSATITGLSFSYHTDKGHGVLELGDIPFDYYEDCGDICIDMNDNLYLLNEESASSFKLEVPAGMKYTDVKVSFDWGDFFEELMQSVEDYVY